MTSTVFYEGELRTRAKHSASGTEIITDAPIDNHGKGTAFSPTDLVATSLASCILTVMGIVAQRHGINMYSSNATIKKYMSSHPRRIAKIELVVEINTRSPLTDTQQKMLERTAKNCPVANSLHPSVVQQVEFVYNIANIKYSKAD